MDRHDDDSRWDYNCPQFVDFTVPMPFNDGADQMFESTVIGEGPSTSMLQFLSNVTDGTTEKPSAASGEPTPQTNISSEHAEEKEEVEREDDQETRKPKTFTKDQVMEMKKHPSNLVACMKEWRSGKKHGSSGPDESPNSKKPRKGSDDEKAAPATDKTAAAPSMLTRSKSLRITKSSSASSLQSEKTARSAATSGARSTRSHTRTFSQGRSRSISTDLKTDGKSKGDTSTTERTSKMPNLLKRLGEGVISNKLKSSEELELERIRQLKKELQHKRQMAQESYKKAMSKAVPVAVHSKDPTVPQAFSFQTDKRLKSQAEKVEMEEKSVRDFVKSLRSRTVVSPTPSISAPKKLTVPQPFRLTEKHSTKGPQASADSKFESMAEKVTAFHRKTPERYRARARSGESGQGRGARSVSPPPRLTQPQTPNLMARGRHRSTHYLSHEQLEMKEVEEMKQNQFKARPVNTKVLANPGIGLKKVPTKPPTEIEEFSLSSGVHKKKEFEEEHFEFHAKPLNKKILEGPVGVKPVKPANPTVPQSPAFALKHRVRLPVELPEEKVESGAPVRAKPVPHTGIPFQPKLPHQHTVPEPFTVEERSKAMLAQKEERIRQMLEEEKKAREFYAQPLPSHEVISLPEKIVKEPTKPEPFELETDQRGALYVQELAHKVGRVQLTEEEEEQKKAAQFRAQPNRTIYKDPFVPARSTRPLTEVSDFELNSERRAMQREEFEMRKKERESELEGHRRQREQREKEEEEAAIAKLRAEMVHHPNPIRRYMPVVIKPSDKPLTDAESPQFSDRLRAKVRL